METVMNAIGNIILFFVVLWILPIIIVMLKSVCYLFQIAWKILKALVEGLWHINMFFLVCSFVVWIMIHNINILHFRIQEILCMEFVLCIGTGLALTIIMFLFRYSKINFFWKIRVNRDIKQLKKCGVLDVNNLDPDFRYRMVQKGIRW